MPGLGVVQCNMEASGGIMQFPGGLNQVTGGLMQVTEGANF